MTRRLYKKVRFASAERDQVPVVNVPSMSASSSRSDDPVSDSDRGQETAHHHSINRRLYESSNARRNVRSNDDYRRRMESGSYSSICPEASSSLRGPLPDYHPPGPGIGKFPGPAPALGRPETLPKGRGAWKNYSCFSKGSKGWKPTIMSLTLAHSRPGEKGPLSPFRPPNISGDDAGYNTSVFRNESDVLHALDQIGYHGSRGPVMLNNFQQDWNSVTSRISMTPDCFRSVRFPFLPSGSLKVDGVIGPNTLNAIEVALSNQNLTKDLFWPEVVSMASFKNKIYGKDRVYNAIEGE